MHNQENGEPSHPKQLHNDPKTIKPIKIEMPVKAQINLNK
jgi:hypothetical protein